MGSVGRAERAAAGSRKTLPPLPPEPRLAAIDFMSLPDTNARKSTGNGSASRNGDPSQAWIDSLENALESMLLHQEPENAGRFLEGFLQRLKQAGVQAPVTTHTPYVNTIPPEDQPPYPGDRDLERKIKSYARWNAMAMVVNANTDAKGIGVGGHISSYASAATIYEVGYNHFFRAPTEDFPGDQVYFQGHVTPGNYARAFLEGRLTEQHLQNFRQELAEGGGLSSYPHPYLMPDFWQFPTVSMGLGPIGSIFHARFLRYMTARNLHPKTDQVRVYASWVTANRTNPNRSACSLSPAATSSTTSAGW
jgi:pyruvate dehydrogenase E1 component